MSSSNDFRPYTGLYADDLAALRAAGATSVRIEDTGGRCFGIHAVIDGVTLTATNDDDHGLLDAADLAERAADHVPVVWGCSAADAVGSHLAEGRGETALQAVRAAHVAAYGLLLLLADHYAPQLEQARACGATDVTVTPAGITGYLHGQAFTACNGVEAAVVMMPDTVEQYAAEDYPTDQWTVTLGPVEADAQGLRAALEEAGRAYLAATTCRVAVRAIKDDSDADNWTILDGIPTRCLGNYDAEAAAIYPHLECGFRGAVIVLDRLDAYGVHFEPGCATWSNCAGDTEELPCSDPECEIVCPVADEGCTEHHHSEYQHARAHHWNCEHTLFGTPEQRSVVAPMPEDTRERFGRWIAETDPTELEGFENVECYQLETCHDQRGNLTARVSRKTWDPNVIEISVLLADDLGYADGYQQMCYSTDPNSSEYPHTPSLEQVMREAIDVLHGFFGYVRVIDRDSSRARSAVVAARAVEPETSTTDIHEDDAAQAHGGYWGQHPEFTVADWQLLVAEDDTRQSYWGWVASNLNT
ncbi:hypothetical protein [Nocardia asiatica]|uniref:hypothetical protein n=1 Tax=Nocardia asiatica TaxID=209252 RepID=UPI0003197271|nr:hypothetical protein [Nocardia asiatica]